MEFTAEDWWALIGPLPVRLTSAIDFVAHDKTRRLAGPHRLGEVTLRPGEGLLFEQRPNEPIDLAGTLGHESWPIIVEGTSPSTAHLEHDVVAAARVARSATLLALEWDEPWAVRTSPKRSLQLPPRIPDFERPNDPWSRPLSPELIREGDATDPIVLPTWLAEAWTAMDKDEYAANAAHAWHEGLLMIASHPSFAAGAFVSAVDAAWPHELGAPEPRRVADGRAREPGQGSPRNRDRRSEREAAHRHDLRTAERNHARSSPTRLRTLSGRLQRDDTHPMGRSGRKRADLPRARRN